MSDSQWWTQSWNPVIGMELPLRWKKPRRVFVDSTGNLFHEHVPFEYIDRVMAVINATAYQLPLPRDVRQAKTWHNYIICTKRPDRMAEYFASRRMHDNADENPIFLAGRGKNGVLRGHGMEIMNAGAVMVWPPPNLCLMTVVENQQQADERISHLLRCPAAMRALSIEPMLGEIDLGLQAATCECCARWPSRWVQLRRPVRPDYPAIYSDKLVADVGIYRAQGNGHGALFITTPGGELGIKPGEFECMPGLDWVVVGGETGPNARPCKREWIESVIEQCKVAGVPVWTKAVPEDLRRRELPKGLIV